MERKLPDGTPTSKTARGSEHYRPGITLQVAEVEQAGTWAVPSAPLTRAETKRVAAQKAEADRRDAYRVEFQTELRGMHKRAQLRQLESDARRQVKPLQKGHKTWADAQAAKREVLRPKVLDLRSKGFSMQRIANALHTSRKIVRTILK